MALWIRGLDPDPAFLKQCFTFLIQSQDRYSERVRIQVTWSFCASKNLNKCETQDHTGLTNLTREQPTIRFISTQIIPEDPQTEVKYETFISDFEQ